MTEVVRVASASRELSVLPILLAKELGLFADFCVTVEFTGSDGGPNAARGLVSGTSDVAVGGIWRPLAYAGQGIADMVVIGQLIARPMSTLMARRKLRPLALEHLVERAILTPWGSPTNLAILRSLAAEAGLLAGPRLVGGIDGEEAIVLFAAGHADFLLTDPVTARTLEVNGGGQRTESFAAVTGDLPWGVMFVDRSVIVARAEPLARFVAAVQEARLRLTAGTITASRAGRAALAACLPVSDPELVADVVRRLVEERVWSGTIEISGSAHRRIQRMLVAQGILSAPLAIEDYYNPQTP